MKTVEYMDPKGRKFARLVDNDEAEEMAQYGIPIGPPDIADKLGLPENLATELHNQLYARKLFTLKDVQKRPREVFAALQATFNINQQKIMNAYYDYEKEAES